VKVAQGKKNPLPPRLNGSGGSIQEEWQREASHGVEESSYFYMSNNGLKPKEN